MMSFEWNGRLEISWCAACPWVSLNVRLLHALLNVPLKKMKGKNAYQIAFGTTSLIGYLNLVSRAFSTLLQVRRDFFVKSIGNQNKFKEFVWVLFIQCKCLTCVLPSKFLIVRKCSNFQWKLHGLDISSKLKIQSWCLFSQFCFPDR